MDTLTPPTQTGPSPQSITRGEALARLTAPGAPYELETLVVYGTPRRAFKHAPRTLRDLYDANVSDKDFLVYGEERLTFAQAHTASRAVARVLSEVYGVGKGDRVAIAMRNYPEWILAFQAATAMGAIAVAVNSLWQSEELEYGLDNCGAKVVFADPERLSRLTPIVDKVGASVIAVRTDQAPPWARRLEDLLAESPEQPEVSYNLEPDDDATIFYTSGSTGHPKGVVSSHRSVIAALLSWELDARASALEAGIEVAQPTEQPAALLAAPLFHATGSHAVYLQSYRAQRRIALMYKWDPAAAAALIEKEKITSFTAPAAMTGDLVREAKRTARDLSSLLAVGGGGAPRAPEQVRQIGTSFAKALPATGWGMTETNAIGTGIGGHDYLNRPASSGRCSAVLDLKIVDDAGKSLGPNQRGELLVRGGSMFRGYWNRPELNAGLFEDGWFRTGDVAYLDAEGYLFIVDRIKDLIIRGGENIGCGQVEAALLSHPQVHEAAVYAVPDERLGEEVGATIYGDPSLEPEALRAFLEGHLAKFEIPRYITIVSAPLPRTGSGKILKRQLREEAIMRLPPAQS